MTRSQRELLVEQYMTSGMSVDQEKEFFMRVATDGELFQTLRSYRMVERALYNDRELIPDGYFAVQSRAMALLVATGEQISAPARPEGTLRSGASGGSFWSMFVSVSMISATVGFFAHAAFAPSNGNDQPVTRSAASGVAAPANSSVPRQLQATSENSPTPAGAVQHPALVGAAPGPTSPVAVNSSRSGDRHVRFSPAEPRPTQTQVGASKASESAKLRPRTTGSTTQPVEFSAGQHLGPVPRDRGDSIRINAQIKWK